uniref:Uncharacterized protein n=1 Tax=Anguilla anguilla TaxID=7936 RepID=A0A0E9V5A7_ANGAN
MGYNWNVYVIFVLQNSLMNLLVDSE